MTIHSWTFVARATRRGDEGCDDVGSAGSTFDRVTTAVLEVDPTFVETVEHPHPGSGVSHALRTKQALPRFPRYWHGANRPAKGAREGVGELVRRHPARALELDHAR